MVLLIWRRIILGLAAATVLIPLITAAASSHDSDDSLEKLAALHNNLGVVHALNDDFDQAELQFDSASMLIGENAAISNNIANNCLCRGEL